MSMLMTQIPDAGFRPFADMPFLKSGLASILRFRVWKGWAVTGNRCRISSINSTSKNSMKKTKNHNHNRYRKYHKAWFRSQEGDSETNLGNSETPKWQSCHEAPNLRRQRTRPEPSESNHTQPCVAAPHPALPHQANTALLAAPNYRSLVSEGFDRQSSAATVATRAGESFLPSCSSHSQWQHVSVCEVP